MMNFLKDWIIQYKNKFSVGGVETTIDRVTGTVSQKGDTIKACYLNEIQKNCIYQVNATRVIEGVLEIYDISIDGSEDFTPFNQTFLIDFDTTNTRVDSLLRFNGITYSLRFSDSIANGDIAPKISDIPKRALIKLDVSNSKAIIIDDRTIIQSLLDLKAGLNSPILTGTPTAPTPTTTDNSTKVATTAFVQAQKASPAFTGTPTAPTAAVGTDTTQIATTAFVQAQKASPILTGTPTAPTPTTTDNSTKVATTAFVQAQKASPAFTGTPTAPTGTAGSTTKQVATQEFATNQDLGIGQTWQDVTAVRTSGTTYANTTGKPIEVIVSGLTTSSSQGIFEIYVNSVTISLGQGSSQATTSPYRRSISFIVPVGATYRVDYSLNTVKWFELR